MNASTVAFVELVLLVVLLGILWTLLRKAVRWIRLWHRGKHFRSYTEIAWARWFERQGIGYAYEPRPFFFRSPEGRRMGYLPDFLLLGVPDRELGPWVEIKGKPPTPIECWKCEQLARMTAEHVTLLAGWPGKHRTYQFCPPGVSRTTSDGPVAGGGADAGSRVTRVFHTRRFTRRSRAATEM